MIIGEESGLLSRDITEDLLRLPQFSITREGAPAVTEFLAGHREADLAFRRKLVADDREGAGEVLLKLLTPEDRTTLGLAEVQPFTWGKTTFAAIAASRKS